MGDRNSEGDGKREKDGECEADWDKNEEGVEPVNTVGIVKKKESLYSLISSHPFSRLKYLHFLLKKVK